MDHGTVWDNSKLISNDQTACFPIPCPKTNSSNSLANAEMRLILTKLLWHFDFELQPESLNWAQQKSFSLWSRQALMVKLVQAGAEV